VQSERQKWKPKVRPPIRSGTALEIVWGPQELEVVPARATGKFRLMTYHHDGAHKEALLFEAILPGEKPRLWDISRLVRYELDGEMIDYEGAERRHD
jgi:hypothetical protein